jgi:hypothetical protein
LELWWVSNCIASNCIAIELYDLPLGWGGNSPAHGLYRSNEKF